VLRIYRCKKIGRWQNRFIMETAVLILLWRFFFMIQMDANSSIQSDA